MNRLLIVIIFIIMASCSSSHKVFFGIYCEDNPWLEYSSNRKTLVVKDGVDDGHYILVKSNEQANDTLLECFIKRGKMNGLLKRWDSTVGYLEEESNYKRGRKHGISKYFFIGDDGVTYVNIELFRRGVQIKTIQSEW